MGNAPTWCRHVGNYPPVIHQAVQQNFGRIAEHIGIPADSVASQPLTGDPGMDLPQDQEGGVDIRVTCAAGIAEIVVAQRASPVHDSILAELTDR